MARKNANTNVETNANDNVVENNTMNGGAETIVAPAAPERAPVTLAMRSGTTKADKAREIFLDCYKDFHTDPKSVPARKDIIGRLMGEAGLTANGAATYLQNMKSKAGLVAKK
jgi:hypothetical protein